MKSPTVMGAMITLNKDFIIPKPSTRTLASARRPTKRGVTAAAVTVDKRVINIDTGRSPPAMKQATLEACEPGQQA
eukprot:CAMPEP_0184293018 /NCGR_PEP_ID=MMETSP1049-20130417/4626_1 /TAXON_ID=77928 /ORGANISM="Proteomonas sulcata, Strain CCMP704" /LENGTH=75 /DNA_ID=CAMNT_0026600945 /DNA_START=663 /DNA_END=887 /DNA_ORIENTATION=+